MKALVVMAVAAAVLCAPPLEAQRVGGVQAYFLNVGVWSDSGAAGEAGATDLQRIRLMAEPRAGAWRLEAALETFITLTSRSGGGGFGAGLGAPASGEFLHLRGTLASGTNAAWRYRMDRLALHYGAPGVEVTAGRQAVSWATTLLLTPADPFAPFDPADPFREYRAGVDALRVLVTPGPFTEVDGVVRLADTPEGRRTTAGVRTRATVRGVELSGWGGAVYSEPAGGLGATVTAAGAALRGELEVRRSSGATIVRGTVGADRSWEVAGRTLYLGAEVQHDDFGAASASELPAVAVSPPAQRGELQVLGRDEVVLQATYQVHPLVGLELLGLLNLGDHSALVAPAISWSAGGNLTLRGGAFVGFGRSGTVLAPGSEYGLVPMTLYASAALFL